MGIPTFTNIAATAPDAEIPRNTLIATHAAGLDGVARVRLNVTITRDDGRLAAVGIVLTPDGAVIDHPGNLSAIVPGDVLATLPAWLRRELEYAALTTV